MVLGATVFHCIRCQSTMPVHRRKAPQDERPIPALNGLQLESVTRDKSSVPAPTQLHQFDVLMLLNDGSAIVSFITATGGMYVSLHRILHRIGSASLF
jgi:hypothetical protein